MARGLYLSATGFNKLEECGHSWELEYDKRLRPPFGDQRNVLRGNALHHLMEYYIDRKENNPDIIVQNAPKYWKKEVAAAKIINWLSDTDEETLRTTYLQWAGEMARLFRENNLDPVRMKSEFKADIDVVMKGIPFRMGGRIDILMEGKHGDLIVLDLKGSANAKITKEFQLIWYVLQLEERIKKSGKDAKLSYAGWILPGIKGGILDVRKISEEAKENMRVRIHAALTKIVEKDFKAVPEQQRCYWCPVKAHCKLFKVEGKAGTVDLLGGL